MTEHDHLARLEAKTRCYCDLCQEEIDESIAWAVETIREQEARIAELEAENRQLRTETFDAEIRKGGLVDKLDEAAEFACRRESEAATIAYREEVEAEVKRLREALTRITTEHISYDSNEGTPYGVGVTDGHRCAARIASAALAEKGDAK